ncbi:MAG TPA: aryl-sulfate sulfotransferase, partial [Polyangiaceae bacterium]|nr:aryl-sulfate sulfotransferase [Polyangiaceae bacterium]
HSPAESRAVEYLLDTKTMTATLVWEFRHSPPIFTAVTGSVERLANGNTLVAFAFAGVVDEVDTSGRLLWEAQIFKGPNQANTYRVRRLPSLYGFETP